MAATDSARPADHALASLPTRPPTPPKEAPSRVTSAPVKPAVRQTLSQHHSLQTPPSIHSLISPATTESNTGSARLRKKVEWSNLTEYKDAPQYSEGERLAKSSPLAAATAPKPVKGILKASSSPCQPSSTLNTRFGSLDDQCSISDMLDSTIKQLSGADRDSKIDAYVALARALKTSNNLPDRVALQGKLSLLTQFIQRDITLKSDSGVLDRSLINHALSLLITFLHFNAIASTISSDFAVFITDHAIRSFEDPTIPKEVVRYLMQVMAFQSFSPKVMSQDRVGRLLSAIHEVEGHLSGKSIVMSRIQLYKRLVKQCPHHMKAHTIWLQDVFTDMLSLTKDIRTEAINLGMDAGFQLRHDKQVLRHAMEVLQTETDDKSFVQYYMERLREMLKERERSASVPPIWAVINLFMRCPLERWDLYGPWLTVVQTAFNTADNATKLEANYAWNRYVYQCLSEGKVSSKSLTTLCQPLLSQLRRKASQKHPEDTAKLRRAAIGGASNLFYYAFRPGNDRHSPDMVWDIAVQPVLSQLITLGDSPDAPGDWVLQSARLLNGLLDGATPRVWRDDRIQDANLIRTDELPPLDPKWTRRNSDRVFSVLVPILEHKVLDLANQESVAYRLWHSAVGAVAAASAKDIKVSDDTVNFFANSFGLIYKLWAKGAPADQSDAGSHLLKGVGNMVQIMINSLGILPFTEKKLSMITPNSFESVPTPSTRFERSDKAAGVVRSPMLHLLNLFCTMPEGIVDGEELSNLIMSTFEPFFAGKSEKGRLEQTRELLRSLPRNVVCPSGIWSMAAQNLELPFTKSLKEADRGDKILGPEYREMISFLERGLTCHPGLPSEQWLSLLDTVDKHVLQHYGQSGRVLVIIEPMAKILIDVIESEQTGISEHGFIATGARLLNEARFPQDKKALDTARRHLWGAAPAASQHESFRPFDNLYKLANLAAKMAYNTIAVSKDHDAVVTLFDSLTAFIVASGQQASTALCALEGGLLQWIVDEQDHFAPDGASQVGQAFLRLWNEICAVLIAFGKPRNGRLDSLEPFMLAGCKSKHMPVLTIAADTWNKMTGEVDEPECSDSLKSVLSSLSTKVDAETIGNGLPSNGSGAQAPAFTEQHNLEDAFASFAQASSSLSQISKPINTPTPSKAVSTSALSKKTPQRQEVTPRRTRSRAKQKTSTPRLRHDNSQIEFTAVASSSPLREESQHLTERQKEVRERQRTDRLSVPGRDNDLAADQDPQDDSSQPIATSAVQRAVQPHAETTPEPRASYEDLISSTPTPRRGQVLQIDCLNDPPSSPPELRPYPLLSEIRTRSRANSSLEQWEFSSPPGSPPGNDQGLPTSRTKANSPLKQSTKPSPDQGHPPTSIEASAPSSVEATSPTAAEVETPARGRRQKRKHSRNYTLDRPAASTEVPPRRALRSQPHDTASEGNVGGQDEIGLDLAAARVSPATAEITPQQRRASKKGRTSPPAEASIDEVEDIGPHRQSSRGSRTAGDIRVKRKNQDTAQDEGHRKRRKSSRRLALDSLSDADTAASSPGGRTRTRRGKRVKQDKEQRMEASGTTESVDDASMISPPPAKNGDEAGDTDEELLSQLMADSQAASLSQSQPRSARGSPIKAASPKKQEAEEEKEEQMVKIDQEKSHTSLEASSDSPNAVNEILGMLRRSRDMLQNASMGREQVDEFETMLIDLKREVYQAEYRGRKS